MDTISEREWRPPDWKYAVNSTTFIGIVTCTRNMFNGSYTVTSMITSVMISVFRGIGYPSTLQFFARVIGESRSEL